MKKLILIASFLFIAILSSSCTDLKAKVESDTSWSGSFGDRTVDGSGNQTIDLPDDEPQCCVAQKNTTGGKLKITIINDTANPLATKELNSSETYAQYGVVSVCSK